MKPSPLLLALGAAAVAVFVLARARPAPAATTTPGLLDRVRMLGDFVSESVEYAKWGDLSAVTDDKGRRVETVPLPDDVRAGIADDYARLDWFSREWALSRAYDVKPAAPDWFTPPGFAGMAE